MDRREFVRFLALTAAGASALPEQVQAFEHYYDVNTPKVKGSLIAVDEVLLCGLATKSTRIMFESISDQGPMNIGFNAFGGIMRWVAAPMQLITTTKFSWLLRCLDKEQIDDEWVRENMTAHVSYIDQSSVRHTTPIMMVRGTL